MSAESDAGKQNTESELGGFTPFVPDLGSDGVELVTLDDSTAFYDINGGGYRERMA